MRITFDRPRRRNALDEQAVLELLEQLTSAPSEIVLLGSKDPAIFCAGADLDIPDEERTRVSDLLYECYRVVLTRPGPVIAVVEGPAVGGGAQLATAADLRIAGPGARFRWVGPGHGLAVGAWLLPDLVGRGTALDLTLTGRWVDAAEAVRIGLLTGVHENPWQAAESLAGQLAGLEPAAVARTKSISTTPDLLARLESERRENAAAWSGTPPRRGAG